MRLLEGLVALLGLLGSKEAPTEVYAVDLERAIGASVAGSRARAELSAIQTRYQVEAERREARIVGLRKTAARTRTEADRRALERAVDEHARLLSEVAEQLRAAEEKAISPIVERARSLVTSSQTPGRLILVMEDSPLVAAPSACDLSPALTKALDGPTGFEPPRSDACRARVLVALGFDGAVKSSAAGVEAAKRIEAKRAEMQAELDAARRRLEALSDEARYAEELELADRFRRNQALLAAMEEEEEGRLFVRLQKATMRAAAGQPELRFVDAARLDLPGLRTCVAESWSKDVLDGRAEIPALLRLCKLTPAK